MPLKKDIIIQEVQNLWQQYHMVMSLRQIYYRLVAKQIIENKVSQYKYLSKVLVDARKEGVVPFGIMEDRTRDITDRAEQYYVSPEDQFDYQIRSLLDSSYHISRNLYQDKLLVIALEKQALESVFLNAIPRSSNAMLLVCRGYNSLTQLKELQEKILKDDREVHCRFFSDYDPTGLDIQRNFEAQMEELGIHFKTFERIGLTKPQIRQYGLPSAPVKTSDSRSQNWTGGGVVELDALDPPILQQMIKDCIGRLWNAQTETEVRKLRRLLARQYEAKLDKVRALLQGI